MIYYNYLHEYTSEYFRTLLPRILMHTFNEAKEALVQEHDLYWKKKIRKDIDTMRMILKG